MKKYLSTAALVLISLMASLAIGVSTARGQTYSVMDLGVVEEMVASEATAINNQGHMTGWSYAGEKTCAFLFAKSIEDAGGVDSRGFGINSASMVVGDNFFSNPGPILASHAALFKGNEVVVDLGVLEGQAFSRANGINAIGQVVGFSGRERDSAESLAFIWTAQTGMIDIGTLGGSYAQAYAINDAGFITGTAQTWAAFVTTHAFIYQPLSGTERVTKPMRDLGVLGGNSSYGMAINVYNHVAGYSNINWSDQRVHAFFHDGRKMNDLGSLGGTSFYSDSSVALGINNSDQIVGFSYLPAMGIMPIRQVAFLWSRDASGVGKMKNLNDMIGKVGRYYWLFSATAINDKGQIVASASDLYNGGVRALLLTPMQGN